MGLMLAEPGFHTRCWVEWEEYPRSVIVAAQRSGYFAPAPIWDDLTTFDAKPFAGCIDTLLAGYPCQPFSHAGQRKGPDDERHLWPDVARVARELGPSLEWLLLENVAGHVTLGLETVLRDLRDMDFTPAVGLFTAAETGAPHERERVFIVAHRLSPGLEGQQPGQRDPCGRKEPHGLAGLSRRAWVHPPGPADTGRWADVLVTSPDLAPSASFGDLASFAGQVAAMAQAGLVAEAEIEPALRRMADGLALRSRALRLLGNGVHPLAAGHAWRTLSAAHGLWPLDLASARDCDRTGADEFDMRKRDG